MSMEDQGDAPPNLPGNQNNSPGSRGSDGKGVKIDDLKDHKACHQCRQKTRNFAASCKNIKKVKPCSLKFCHKCLLNRYGENAAEVESREVWSCPKCRGICNCSICMKKRGYEPTGILAHTAKATGFSSVTELLNSCGHENLCVSYSRKRGKENSFDGNTNQELCSGKKKKKLDDDKTGKTCNELSSSAALRKSTCEKGGIFEQGAKETDEHGEKDANVINSPKKTDRENMLDENIEPTAQKDMELRKFEQEDADEDTNSDVRCKQIDEAYIMDNCTQNMMNKYFGEDIPMPKCSDLTTILGIELLLGDVGPAIQFLEFCSAFGEVLKFKKGQAESILRELVCSRDQMYGRAARRAQYSSAVQFHIQMLDMIMGLSGDESLSSQTTNGKDSWFEALGKCVPEAYSLFDVPSDCFTKRVDGYSALDGSKKLRLLNILCDKALGTVELRKWIDDQRTKCTETKGEAKERVDIARVKKTCLKQKLDELVKKAEDQNEKGVPPTISEHEAIVALKEEVEQAAMELAAAEEMLPKITQSFHGKHAVPLICSHFGSLLWSHLPPTVQTRTEAFRTEPVFCDVDGRIFWKLNCISGGPDVLIQELKRVDEAAPDEVWATYNPEDSKAVEEYIASRKKRKEMSARLAKRYKKAFAARNLEALAERYPEEQVQDDPEALAERYPDEQVQDDQDVNP